MRERPTEVEDALGRTPPFGALSPQERSRLIPYARLRRYEKGEVGTTIETAIRIMSRWNRDGVVRTEPSSFVIPNRQALETIIAEP